MLPALAFGHSPLKSVDPIDKAVLTEAPTEYKMIFKTPAKLIKFEILKQAEETDKKLSPVKLSPPSFGTKLTWSSYQRSVTGLTKFAGVLWEKMAMFLRVF